MTSRMTLSKLALAAVVAAGAVTLVPPAATAVTGPAARATVPVRAKVVRVWSTKHKVILSDSRFRPGATEFRVRHTPSKNSTLVIIRTAHLQLAMKKIQIAIGGGAGSANAMAAFDRLVTAYSGGGEGARWQVRLPKGQYYAIDTGTNSITPFTVAGTPRLGRLHPATMEVSTTKANQFQTSGSMSGPWIAFTNGSREIHFLDGNRVKADVTNADVRKALKSSKDPAWILPGGFHFEMESPGVTSVHRQDTRPTRYLLMCWMPSEQMDGMPHALMGMWRLVPGTRG